MSCAPLQLSDEDEHRSGDVLLGDEIAPKQLASVERSTILLKEYDFLPRELYLVVDSRPGASGSCQVTAAYRTFWLIARDSGCGGVQWPAAEIMANYLTHLHGQGTLESWTCQSILELGSGTGVLSMALATLLPQGELPLSMFQYHQSDPPSLSQYHRY